MLRQFAVCSSRVVWLYLIINCPLLDVVKLLQFIATKVEGSQRFGQLMVLQLLMQTELMEEAGVGKEGLWIRRLKWTVDMLAKKDVPPYMLRPQKYTNAVTFVLLLYQADCRLIRYSKVAFSRQTSQPRKEMAYWLEADKLKLPPRGTSRLQLAHCELFWMLTAWTMVVWIQLLLLRLRFWMAKTMQRQPRLTMLEVELLQTYRLKEVWVNEFTIPQKEQLTQRLGVLRFMSLMDRKTPETGVLPKLKGQVTLRALGFQEEGPTRSSSMTPLFINLRLRELLMGLVS